MAIIDPKSPAGKRIIDEAATMQPTTQGDPPPPSLVERLRAAAHSADCGQLLREAADALDSPMVHVEGADHTLGRLYRCASTDRKVALCAALEGMPDEGFGYFALACVQGAMTHGALAQIWPDGIGGFTGASRAAITEVRALADAYLEEKRS